MVDLPDTTEQFFGKVFLNLLEAFDDSYGDYSTLYRLSSESIFDGPWFIELREMFKKCSEEKGYFFAGNIKHLVGRKEVLEIVEQIKETYPQFTEPFKLQATSKTLGDLLDLTPSETLILDMSCRLVTCPYNYRCVLDGLDIRYSKMEKLYSALLKISEKDGQKAIQGILFNAGILAKDSCCPSGMWGLSGDLGEVFSQKDIQIDTLDQTIFPHMLSTELTTKDYPHLEKEIGRCIDIIEKNNSKSKKENGVNVMFWGLAGSGKTELAVAIAKERGWNLKVIGDVDPNDMQENSRHSRLTSLKLASKIYRNVPNTVLLFDEIEDLFKHDANATFSKAFINRIIETTNIPIIWTTNNLTILGQPVLRRMIYNIPFEVPPVEAREVIWKKYIDQYKVKISTDDLTEVAKNYAIPPALIKNAVNVTSKAFGRKKVLRADLIDIVGSLDTLVNYGYKKTVDPEKSRKQDDTYDVSCVNTEHDLSVFTTQLVNAKNHGFALCLYGAPGTGKCLAPNEKVMMSDGLVKESRDLEVGDTLMGPDSNTRTILSRSTGFGEMFEVTPTKGKSWRCNGDHILSLRASAAREMGKIKFVSVRDWFGWSDAEKTRWKMWRAAVDFPSCEEPLIDPYLIGLFLGDGSCSRTGTLSVHNADNEITEYLRNQAIELGMMLRERNYEGKSATDHAFVLGPQGHNSHGSFLRSTLEELGMFRTCENKKIPFNIKTGSRLTRRRVLAGLLDADGHYDKSGVFDFISKSEELSNDVVFVARSLGLAAYSTEAFKRAQNGVGGNYYRVCISGHLNIIPTLISRKKARIRSSYKDVTNVGFSIKKIDDGEFVGITIDGDHQYLLDDFTVTHNSEYGRHIAREMGKEVLFKRASDLQSMWVGECEKNIAKAFEEARRDNKVLIIDEGDSFLRDRTKARASWEVSQVNEMLSQMERHPQPFIITTNLMNDLDSASLRRFTFKMKFDYLRADQAVKLFENFFGIKPPDEIRRNSILAPGDFANVKRQADILGIKDAGRLYRMLDEETKLKPGKRNNIGF